MGTGRSDCDTSWLTRVHALDEGQIRLRRGVESLSIGSLKIPDTPSKCYSAAAAPAEAAFAEGFFRATLLAGFAAFAARYSAQRFLVASAIAFLPAAEIFRFLGAAAGAVISRPFTFAHRLRCASAIFRRAAALNLWRLRGAAASEAVARADPGSIARSSEI